MESGSIEKMEEVLSSVLRVGVQLSAALIIIGLGMMVATGNTSCPFGVADLGWLIWGSPFLAPSHIFFLGFAVLIATPVFRVMASILIYMKTSDRPFATITALVLLILIASFIWGVG